jgi:glutamine cyclotransferase
MLLSRAAWVLVPLFVAISPPTAHAEPVPVIAPTVIAAIPHDPAGYSEGLEFDGPALYESTGETGRSQLRQVDPATGSVTRRADLPPAYFGEGITVVGDRIWQLTYRNGVAIEWDKASFKAIREVPVDERSREERLGNGQAWGLCRDGDRLIRSDGSNRLRFHDIDTFAETGGVNVTRDGAPFAGLDELECVDGQVWAAAWPADQFVRIDPATGAVNLVLDVSTLWRFGARSREQVVSGIAHIAGDDYLISGKNWPQSFRIRVDAGR